MPTPTPAERLFTRRELLLTTPEERRKLSPEDEHTFDKQRYKLRLDIRDARMSFDACQTKEAEEVAAGVPDPEKLASSDMPPAAVRRRHPAAAPG